MFNNFPFNQCVVHTFASSYYGRAIKIMFDFKNIKNVLFLMKVRRIKRVEKEDLTLL